MNETLHISDLHFEVRRSPRRKTLGLTVDRAGELVVHAPASASEDELRRWVGRKLVWVHQKLALKERSAGTTSDPEFVSGESISYLGRNYRLKLVDAQDMALRFDGHWFLLRRGNRSDATEHFRDWYIRKGTDWLSNRMGTWERKTGTGASRIVVRDLGFRWGSCGKNAVLLFNWRLLQLPIRLVDYVIVHELVHLCERGHTSEFWRILDRVLPDWRDRKLELEVRWKSYLTFGMGNSRGGVAGQQDLRVPRVPGRRQP